MQRAVSEEPATTAKLFAKPKTFVRWLWVDCCVPKKRWRVGVLQGQVVTLISLMYGPVLLRNVFLKQGDYSVWSRLRLKGVLEHLLFAILVLGRFSELTMRLRFVTRTSSASGKACPNKSKSCFSKLAYFVLLSIPFCRDYTVLYQMTMTKKQCDLQFSTIDKNNKHYFKVTCLVFPSLMLLLIRLLVVEIHKQVYIH